MGKVAVTNEMSEFIGDRIASFASEAEERIRWLAPYVSEHDALPLYLGWTATIGIQADGEIVSWSTEGDYAGVRSVEDCNWELAALAVGSKRYPKLRGLLPIRSPGAIDCRCQNHPLFASGQVICEECCGLGWLPNSA